jgi:hypothetical protein
VRQNETLLSFITRNPPKSPAILSAKISLESDDSSELIEVELSPMRKISSESSPAEDKSGIDVDVVELLKEEIKLSRIMLDSVVDVAEVDISPEEEEDSSIVGLPGVLIFTSSLPSSVREYHFPIPLILDRCGLNGTELTTEKSLPDLFFAAN